MIEFKNVAQKTYRICIIFGRDKDDFIRRRIYIYLRYYQKTWSLLKFKFWVLIILEIDSAQNSKLNRCVRRESLFFDQINFIVLGS